MQSLAEPAGLADRLVEIDARIADAARAAGRDPAAITRIVVTKFHPAVARRSAVRARRARCRREPAAGARREGAGRRAAAGTAVALHRAGADQQGAGDPGCGIRRPLDRPRAHRRRVRRGRRPRTTRPRRAAAGQPDRRPRARRRRARRARALAEHVAGCRTLRVRGVMAVAPLDEPPAPAFERLRALRRPRPGGRARTPTGSPPG